MAVGTHKLIQSDYEHRIMSSSVQAKGQLTPNSCKDYHFEDFDLSLTKI